MVQVGAYAGHLNVTGHCAIIRVCIVRQFVRGSFVCSRRFKPLRSFEPEASSPDSNLEGQLEG